MKTLIKHIKALFRAELAPCYGCNAPHGKVQLYDTDGNPLALCRNLDHARRIANWNGLMLIEE